MKYTAILMIAFLLVGSVALRSKEKAKIKDYEIEEFFFSWTIDNISGIELAVMKGSPATFFTIAKSENKYERVSFSFETPAEVVRMGEYLSEADTIYKKQKVAHKAMVDKKLILERMATAKHEITFHTTSSGFFYITMKDRKKYSQKSIDIPRRKAKQIAEYLKDAKGMVAFIDRKLAFTDDD